MATPLIVHWPDGIASSRRGHWVEAFGYLPDFTPTCLELAGGQYPESFQGQEITPHAGKSLVSLIRHGERPIHNTPVFWEHEGNRAARDGDWKLVWKGEGPWEMYDLATDRTESRNLVNERPRLAADLQRQWEGWARRTGVQFQTSFSYYQMIRDYIRSQKAEL